MKCTKLTLSQTSPGFKCLLYKSFENTVGKGEIACNKYLWPNRQDPMWLSGKVFDS